MEHVKSAEQQLSMGNAKPAEQFLLALCVDAEPTEQFLILFSTAIEQPAQSSCPHPSHFCSPKQFSLLCV